MAETTKNNGAAGGPYLAVRRLSKSFGPFQALKQVRASGGHGGAIFKLVRHPKQPLLITCSADKTVRVWNEDSGAQVRVLNGHTDYVYAVAVSPDGNLIASGSWNGEVKVWQAADGKLVNQIAREELAATV